MGQYNYAAVFFHNFEIILVFSLKSWTKSNLNGALLNRRRKQKVKTGNL
jgi:hypothetical protein